MRRIVGLLPVVAVALAGCAGPGEGERPGGTVTRLDPGTLAVRQDARVEGNPCGVAVGAGRIYVADLGTSTTGEPGPGAIVEVERGRVARRIGLGERAPCEVAVARDGVVVALDGGGVSQLGPRRWTVDAGDELSAVAAGGARVWLGDLGSDRVVGLDARSGRRVADLPRAGGPIDVAATALAAWVAQREPRGVLRIDARTGAHRRTAVRGEPRLIAAGRGGVFVRHGARSLSRLHPRTGRVVATRRVAAAAEDLAVGAGAVWLLDDAGAVLRVDPRTLRVTGRARIAGDPFGLAVDARGVWVGVRAT